MRKQIKTNKFYTHGDECEDAPGTFYCATCDIFVEAGHLAEDPREPADARRHLEATERAYVKRFVRSSRPVRSARQPPRSR